MTDEGILRRLFAPRGEIAGTVYGTIVVMGALVAGSKGEADPARLGAIVTGTVVVLWLAHVYSHALGRDDHPRQAPRPPGAHRRRAP